MFSAKFKKIREIIIQKYQFESIVDCGTELFDGKIGHLYIGAWVLRKRSPHKKGIAIDLTEFCYSRRDEKQTEFFNLENRHIFNQQEFNLLPDAPVAYSVSEKTFEYLYLDNNPFFFLSEEQKRKIELNNRIAFHNTNKWIDKKGYKDFNLYKKNNTVYFDFSKREVLTNNDLYLLPSIKFNDIEEKFLGVYKDFYIFIKYSITSRKNKIVIYTKNGLIKNNEFSSKEIQRGSNYNFIDYKKIIDSFIKANHLELIHYEFYNKYAYRINNDYIKEVKTKLEDYSYIYGIVKKEEEKENFIGIRYKQEIYIIKSDSKFNYVVSGNKVENIIENNLNELEKESKKNEFFLNI